MEDDECGYAVSAKGTNPFFAPPSDAGGSSNDSLVSRTSSVASDASALAGAAPGVQRCSSGTSVRAKGSSRIVKELAQRRFSIWSVAHGKESTHKPDIRDYAMRVSKYGAKLCEVAALEATTCGGWLQKKGGVRKNWTKRWFKLDIISQTLGYFEDQQCTKLKGQIEISKVQCARPDFSDRNGKKMTLVTQSRTYYITALSVETMELWLVVLNTIGSDDSVAKDLMRKAATRAATADERKRSSVPSLPSFSEGTTEPLLAS